METTLAEKNAVRRLNSVFQSSSFRSFERRFCDRVLARRNASNVSTTLTICYTELQVMLITQRPDHVTCGRFGQQQAPQKAFAIQKKNWSFSTKLSFSMILGMWTAARFGKSCARP